MCWSKRCGENLIWYNPANFTFTTNAIETNQFGKNGTYIFYVEMEQISQTNQTNVTFTFVLPPSTIQQVHGIKIDMPFD